MCGVVPCSITCSHKCHKLTIFILGTNVQFKFRPKHRNIELIIISPADEFKFEKIKRETCGLGPLLTKDDTNNHDLAGGL